jgi:hypothetical protein
MDFFHETKLVSVAQALIASILEIHIECGILLCLVEELKTNLMSLVVFISLIFAQRVSNINMSIFRSLRL